MDNSQWVKYWRISTTLLGLSNGFFIGLKLPPPDLPDFRPYSQLVPQSQGAQSEQGYISEVVFWDFMDYSQLSTLTRIVEAATNSTLWMTIDRAHGYGLNHFIDVSGIVRPLTFEPVSRGRGVIYANVSLTLNNITIINDPASF